jgi:hypothetical protein
MKVNLTNGKKPALIFFDVNPSEQVQLHEGDYLCFASVCPSSIDGVPKLKSFKKTSKSKKLSEARRIHDLIANGTLKFSSFCLAGKMTGSLIQWAIDSINRSSEKLDLDWIEKENLDKPVLVWKDKEFNFPLAAGIAVYANILVCKGLMYANVAKSNPDIGHLVFALDNLPNSAKTSMGLMRAVSESDPDIIANWLKNLKHGLTYEIGNLLNYKDEKNKNRRGKDHPYAILCDWLAACCMAKLNPNQLCKNTKYSKVELKTFASIVDIATAQNALKIFDIDDLKILGKTDAQKKSKK